MVTTGPFDLTGLSPDRQLNLARGLRRLLLAHEGAARARDDPWQFAVPVAELLGSGLDGADVRWLIARGLADHAAEQDTHENGKRVFVPGRGSALDPNSVCLVLSAEAAEAVRDWGRRAADAVAGLPAGGPGWDGDLRVLHFAGVVVKHFRVPAPSQEQILAAFQEEGWPRRIDDPLPVSPSEDRGERLHAAVRGLNRGQAVRRIRFTRDGRGEGVCWSAVGPSDPPRQVNPD